MSRDAETTRSAQAHISLNPHDDAREIVRLLQCPQCSYPYRSPLTLPCGNSLCRDCVPPLFKRENITYPLAPGRSEGFICPFKDCAAQHTIGDCSLDVTLNKIVEMARSCLQSAEPDASQPSIRLDEKLHWPNVVDSSMDIMPRSRILHGCRLVAAFGMADMGELDYHSELAFTTISEADSGTIESLDQAVASRLTQSIRGEVECQVCYAIMLDPLTTACGHTLCRKCVARVLDHSNTCPVCRRRLSLRPGVQHEPSNKGISQIISSLLAEQLSIRVSTAESEHERDNNTGVPLFPCTLAYPHMPTFLHIFEPRYRLMIRRTLENGTRQFGMLSYNASRRPQGTLGSVPFLQYGTMLHIQRVEMFPDGRSLIETTGAYRFRVLEYSMRDGYMVGTIQRVDDISLAEEEAVEAQETSAAEPLNGNTQADIDTTSTQGLLQMCLDFIQQARERSAPWLHERVLAAYGQPPSDPAIFPYWFASVLPISDDEKYLLLPTSSVRQRLKLTLRWIQRLEAARCAHEAPLARTVLDDSSDEEEEEEDDDDENGNEVVELDNEHETTQAAVNDVETEASVASDTEDAEGIPRVVEAITQAELEQEPEQQQPQAT